MIDRYDFTRQCKAKFNELYQDFTIVYFNPITEPDQWIFSIVILKNGDDKQFASPKFSISRGLVKYSTWGQIVQLLYRMIESGYEYLSKEAA